MITPVYHVKVEFEAPNTPQEPALTAIVDTFKGRVLGHYPRLVLRLNPKVWKLNRDDDHYHLFAEVADLHAAEWVEAAMHCSIESNGGKVVQHEG